MRAAKIIFVIWLLSAMAIWIRQGNTACVGETLPFVERGEPLSRRYDVYALAIVAMGIVGYFAITTDRSKLPPVIQPKRAPIAVILLVAFVTALALAIFANRIRPAVRFNEVVGASGSVAELRHLALLALTVIVFLLAVRWFRDR